MTDRGHVEPLLLGKFRVTRAAAHGAVDAAQALAQLGEVELASQCRLAYDRLKIAMDEMRARLPHD